MYERVSPDYLAMDQAETVFSSVGTQFKEILTTSLSDTIDPSVTIGEEIVYRLAVNIPEDGALNQLVIEDILPSEVVYVSSE